MCSRAGNKEKKTSMAKPSRRPYRRLFPCTPNLVPVSGVQVHPASLCNIHSSPSVGAEGSQLVLGEVNPAPLPRSCCVAVTNSCSRVGITPGT